MFWLYTSNCAIMNVLQTYSGFYSHLTRGADLYLHARKDEERYFYLLQKSFRIKDKRNMTPLTYKRCVYPNICVLLLSLVYKHSCLLTHPNENFRKPYE